MLRVLNDYVQKKVVSVVETGKDNSKGHKYASLQPLPKKERLQEL